MAAMLHKRQDTIFVNEPNGDVYEYDTKALIIKWIILGALVFIIMVWLVGGYLHAQSRMKKNLPLLAYHRFLVPRSQRVRFPPARVQNQFSFYRAQEEGAYGLEDMPPPVYDPNHPPPPLYQPPQGASKVNPRQDYDRPPAGSPPQSAPRKHSAELPPRPAPRSWSSRINPFRK